MILRAGSFRTMFLAVECMIVAVFVMVAVATAIEIKRWNQETEAGILRHGLAEASLKVNMVGIVWDDLAERMEGIVRIGEALSDADARGNQDEVRIRELELRAALSVAGRVVLQLSIARPDGLIWWSTASRFVPGTSVFDRSYFQAIVRDGKYRDIEGPLVGRMTGHSSIKFAFAARDLRGQLVGVAIVSLQESEVQRLARASAPVSPVVFAVFERDGTVISTTSGNNRARIDRDQEWFDAINAVEPVAEFGPSPLDGVTRFAAYLAVPHLDLLVGVGLGEETWVRLHDENDSRGAFLVWLALGCLTLVLVIAAVMIWRVWRGIEDGFRRSAIEVRKDFLHQISDQTSDMIAVLDHEYRYVYANASAATLLGVPLERLIGQPAGTLVHPGDRSTTFARAWRRRAPGAIATVTFRFTRGDSTERWLEAQLNPIVFEQARQPPFHGTFMIARDVTEQRRASQTLTVLQAERDVIARTGPGTLYQAVIQPDGHWRVIFPIGLGRLANTLDINATAACEDFLSLVHPEDLDILRTGKGGFDRTDETCLEYRWVDGHGQQRFIRDLGVVTTRAADRIEVSGYLFDVTREVEQRQRLDRASRLLSLGQMAVGLAHELNQPLAAISMAAENGAISLEMGAKGQAIAQQKFERISALALRAGDIIEHIRQFGRPGKASGQPTDVAAVIEEACLVLHERAERDGITVSRSVEASLPPARATPGLLQQVLVNLIANACDALVQSERGGDAPPRQIDIAAQHGDGTVRVRVSDNGGGIPDSAMAQIFEPFFTTKPVGQGTGLGLSVSFGIVGNFGGAIHVRNKDGGAVFDIELPVWTDGPHASSFVSNESSMR